MQRYDSYKPSGVKWLGEIPSHWEVISTKYIAKLYTGNSLNDASKEKYSLFSDDSYPYIASKDISLGTGTVDYDNGLYIPKDESFFEIAPKNSFLLCIEGGSAGRKKAFLDRNCCFVNKLCCFDSVLNPKYHYYFIQGDYFRTMFNCSLQGMIGGVSVSALKNFYTIVPPLEEQTAIASYLDTATAKIDAAIAQQQKMIDLLNERKQIIINRAVTRGLNPNARMKDSGVEWIGEVPEGWEVKKLKYLAKIFGRIGFRGYNASDLVDEGEGAITLSPSNMKEHKMQYEKCTYLSWDKYFESPEIMINNGDVLFVKTGSTYGKSCLVENLPMEATINPQLVVFKEFNCCNRFFEYLLQSNIIRDQVELSVIGGTIPTISQEKILNYTVPIPSMEEQSIIVDAINSRCKPLNEAISNANKQISLLQERKQIIINEVVTGKVKVG